MGAAAPKAQRVSAVQKMAPMLEADLQTTVIEMARLYGWKVVHLRPARTAHGWRTAYEGDSGVPDLILARRGRVLLVELKSDKGRVKPEQQAWLVEAGENGRLWRPKDLELIKEELRTLA
ncbi:VRR-NUC domain-containing protein [Nocardia niigatensis]